MKRRSFLKTLAAGASIPLAADNHLLNAKPSPRTSMGVVQYSFSASPHTRSAYDFLEYCSSLGAGGIQTGLDSLDAGYLDKLRRRTSELGMYIEVIVSLPQGDDSAHFERHVAPPASTGGATKTSAVWISGKTSSRILTRELRRPCRSSRSIACRSAWRITRTGPPARW